MIKIERTEPKNVTKEDLLNEVSEGVQLQHLLASLEYSVDLMLDMQFKMLDALVEGKQIFLTEEEKATYDELKIAQSAYHTFTLGQPNFPDGVSVVDYMYNIKGTILQKRLEYFKAKTELGL